MTGSESLLLDECSLCTRHLAEREWLNYETWARMRLYLSLEHGSSGKGEISTFEQQMALSKRTRDFMNSLFVHECPDFALVTG
jgi:hypothetical protein